MKKHKKFIAYANGPSLAEINGTVDIPKSNSFWKNIIAFSGPRALVAVGYMDPGNWITSIGGGAEYGYLLLSVVLISSLIAMLLQYMASKLGIVTGLDLAQATRQHTGKKLGFVLWVITEFAIMATDIAEVGGGAIALNLLFLMKLGFRKIEAIVITLITVIMVVFMYEVAISNPALAELAKGFVPQKQILNRGQLTMALGIVGATVMPHNLYLHSSIAQSRNYNRQDEDDVARAVRFSTWDSNIQLTIAFIINTRLLVLGAAMFFGRGEGLGTFTSLYNALQDNKLAGAVASPLLSTLFAVALLASGQNSTITGTLSGQIVMEGFINLKIPTWARRLITRVISVIPVLIAAVYYHGSEGGLDDLMVKSQVFLSIALPVSMIPLVYFTSSEKIMGKRFKNKKIIAGLGWFAAIALTVLNIKLIIDMF